MTEKPKRVFISDWELRQNPGAVPENAIISPLSRDWLEYGRQEDWRTGGLEDWQQRKLEDRGTGNNGMKSWYGEMDLREQIVETGRKLYALGFVPATDGNISARLADGSVLITPSGVSKGSLELSDMSRIGMDGRLISGKKPSSEYLLHLCFYKQRPDAMAVVHAHPPLATGLACAGMALDKPLTSEMVISLGKVPLAGYATPGTDEVTDSVAGLVKEHDAIMLANHGVVTCGRDLETAFQRMETVEQAAKITLAAALAGGGRLIPPEKVGKLDEIRKRLGL